MNLRSMQFKIPLDLKKITFELSFSTVNHIEMVC